MSGCTLELAPAVAVASLIQTGTLGGVARGPFTTAMPCPNSAKSRPDPAARKLLDDQVICAVMCCCAEKPNIGAAERNLRDDCATEVLAAADKALGHKSRYKPQISYDMRPDGSGPPTPLMHRVDGPASTIPSERWQQQAKEMIEGYAGGKGLVRRPDIVIVDDSCLPPVSSNIERVIELKFGADTRNPQQDKAYELIAGGAAKYQVFRTGGVPEKGEHITAKTSACAKP